MRRIVLYIIIGYAVYVIGSSAFKPRVEVRAQAQAPKSIQAIPKAKYDKLKRGMLYFQVKAILGEEGVKTSEMQILEDTSEFWEWNGGGIQVTFTNDQLTSKYWRAK